MWMPIFHTLGLSSLLSKRCQSYATGIAGPWVCVRPTQVAKLRCWHCWTMGERPDKWLCWTKLMPTYEGHEAHIQNNMQNLHLCARSHGTQCVFIDQARRAAWICLLIWCSCHGWRALHHWHVMGAFSGRCCALHPCNV